MIRVTLATHKILDGALVAVAMLLACSPVMAQRTAIALHLESGVLVRWEPRTGRVTEVQGLPGTDSATGTYIEILHAAEHGQHSVGVRAYTVLGDAGGRTVKMRLDSRADEPNRIVVLVHTF